MNRVAGGLAVGRRSGGAADSVSIREITGDSPRAPSLARASGWPQFCGHPHAGFSFPFFYATAYRGVSAWPPCRPDSDYLMSRGHRVLIYCLNESSAEPCDG
jgi:hypothetical protein